MPAGTVQPLSETRVSGHAAPPERGRQLRRGSEKNTSPLEIYEISLLSEPEGMKVWIDGKPVGKTPLSQSLDQGSHRVRMANEEGQRIERTIELVHLGPTRYQWKVEQGDRGWESGYP